MVDLGNLSGCMVDSDAASRARAKRLRRKALAASIALEAVLIAGLVLWPLLTVAVLPSQAFVTPLRPYRGSQPRQPVRPTPPSGSPRPHFDPHPVYSRPTIPTHANTAGDPDVPDVGVDGPAVPGISEGFREGPPINIAPPPLRPQKRTIARSEQVMQAMLVHRVEPAYPRLAVAIHLSGTVILQATIGTDGEIRNLQVVSGNALLSQAAREAVLQWRYRPTLLNGQPVEVETQITVNFILNRGEGGDSSRAQPRSKGEQAVTRAPETTPAARRDT